MVLSPGEVPQELAGNVGKYHEVRGFFESATVWQHDREMGTDDPLHRALAWVELSSAIHDE